MAYGVTPTHAAFTHQCHKFQTFKELAVPVLQPMGLVNDNTTPSDFFQLWTVSQNHFKSCDDHMELKDSWNWHSLLMEKNCTVKIK